MTRSRILAEHAEAHWLRQADIDAFIAEGVKPMDLVRTSAGHYDFIALDRVRLKGSRFEFARHFMDTEGAVNAFVLPIRDELGDLADILAFRPGEPPSTWLGSPIAGAETISAPRMSEPLDVFEGVVEWLRAGRDGLLILDAARAAASLAGVTLRAETLAHARRLRLELARPAPAIVTRQAVKPAKRLLLPRRAS